MLTKKAVTIYQSLGKLLPRRSTSKIPSPPPNPSNPNITKLHALVNRAARVLVKVKAVFPFNFFPDELILDDNAITHRENRFFYTAQIRSIAYEDIFNVIVEYNVLFGTLEIHDKLSTRQPVIFVHHLKRRDAHKVRRIIRGLILAKKEGVDTREIPLNLLIHKAEELGKAKEV